MTGSSSTMLIFLKLGGSLITDKTKVETTRPAVIHRLAQEIQAARQKQPALQLLLGHGSGSFGHYAAQRTALLQRSVFHPAAYAQVGAAAARLNRLVTDICLLAGIPTVALPPSASAQCHAGRLQSLALQPIQQLLAQGAVPLIYGDVALDKVRGATIVSTEDLFLFLAHHLQPDRIILVGQVDGVFTADPNRQPDAQPIPEITPAIYPTLVQTLGGSAGVDVTGGMLSKVQQMVELVHHHPATEVHLISGLQPGRVTQALTAERPAGGTVIRAVVKP